MTTYPETIQLHINGSWRASASGKTIPVVNPANEAVVGQVACADISDLDDALAAAQKGFAIWSRTSAFDRYKVMRRAAEILRERSADIARLMTIEQGKPLAEALGETLASADVIDWYAEEGRRAYGRVIPARAGGVHQYELKEPVGPVAAFSPWNFPLNTLVRKFAGALATGCSIIIKPPEEAPASAAELVRAALDAGLPPEVVSLVYGVPAQISAHLIPHPVIKKISFTGSTAVGKQLAALAGQHMKRATMELGGHAPVIVLKDVDVGKTAGLMVGHKYRNAGQVCVSPTRFLVEQDIYDEFVDNFTALAKKIKVGDGLAEGVTMGPLIGERRVEAVSDLVQDAVRSGAELVTGGNRIGNSGYFYEPTVLSKVPTSARIMNEEPFGPVALMVPIRNVEEGIEEANRLPYGLAAYAFTGSAENAGKMSRGVQAGMLSMNHLGLALAETPFGGINDSGYGKEGGGEALEPYLNTRFVTHMMGA